MKFIEKEKVASLQQRNEKSRLRSKDQVQKIIDNFSSAQMSPNAGSNSGPEGQGTRMLKKQSQLVLDKAVIQENLKNYKPFGEQWVSHKDPEIYESEYEESLLDADRQEYTTDQFSNSDTK